MSRSGARATPQWLREWRATQKRRIAAGEPMEHGGPSGKPSPDPLARLNKTEREYLRQLEARLRAGEYVWLGEHEGIKLRVGADRCWYSPDFSALQACGLLEFHEVKGGRVWDDARVKFQSAKQQYPHFRWVWARKQKGVWTYD